MTILIADDETHIRNTVAEYLRLEGIETMTAANGLSAQKLLQGEPCDALLADLKMPGMTGIELLEWVQEDGPRIPVVIMSAYGEVDDAVRAMKLGASDYVVKPFDPDDLVLRLRRAVDDSRLRRKVSADNRIEAEMADTASPRMREVYTTVAKAAPSSATILITGESGTGKEVLARRIHRLSGRSDGPFVPVNVGAIPETLLESELFGHERGAFTGADKQRRGLFETANSGTIFLDEIGDMPLPLQVKLLRVLQERRIQRLGSSTTQAIDVRVLAATNASLEDRVADGSFREDLFYRLNVIRVELPALRDRREDIPTLAEFFLHRLRARAASPVSALEPDAVRALMAYHFPGNIRELENLIERAMILADSDSLGARDFDLGRAGTHASSFRYRSEHGTLNLKELERSTILECLQRNEWKRQTSADELGITRRTLLNKIKEYGLDAVLEDGS